MEKKNWFDDYDGDSEDIQINEYDITASPNDFNVITMYNFIESKAIKIPAFQRNFVWDIKRSSKLIESLILGLPVPQIFLYEESRNSFLVIDGQQRLLSIYYFIKQRFPRKDKRVELRRIFDQYGKIPDNVLNDDQFFTNFKLNLPEMLPENKNKFKGLNYSTLNSYKAQFELRPIRNIIVKQNSPKDDDSSVYEIFNRLNTGGMNLNAQEIRASLYHSEFSDMLNILNENSRWRILLGKQDPDSHQKDIEIITRSFAMLIEGSNYRNPLMLFLNQFSKKCMDQNIEKISYLKQLFISFIESTNELPTNAFINKKSGRFNIALFEATFVAVCNHPFQEEKLITESILYDNILALENDERFQEASSKHTTDVSNVKFRLQRACEIFKVNSG